MTPPTRIGVLLLALFGLGTITPAARATVTQGTAPVEVDGPSEGELLDLIVRSRLELDLGALERFRPGYAFWQHVFLNPDGDIVFGSAEDGRLLATFPVRGDWARTASWTEESLENTLAGRALPSRLSDRRDRVAELLEPAVGEVVHNPTRGDFLLPNLERYGAFVGEWGRIYERFGVPAEIGLAQAVVESGLRGDIKSEARAIGFCQWLPRNWERLQNLTPHTIEVENQTTQAAFCAAFLAVLATKYGSFLPALSEHHAGIVNVGRTVINGGRLGAGDVRERYLVGADLARDLRQLSPRTFRRIVGTYGPRSYRYAEMIFGNAPTVERIRTSVPQERIHAYRVPEATSFDRIIEATGLSRDEVERFNPALVRRVPASAVLYLPEPVEGLGEDVAYWHRPVPAAYREVLVDFLRLDATLEDWESPAMEDILLDYRNRFRDTGTEEGLVMAAVLGYVVQELPLGRRILTEFRTDSRVTELFERGVRLREASSESSSEPSSQH